MIDQHNDAPGIAIVRSSRGWARTLHRYVVDHGGAVVRARPLEERQAIEEGYEVLIADDISSFLSRHIVEELHRRGRRVLGVYDPDEMAASGESTGKLRLLRLGVDGVIEAHASPEEFVRVIEDLAPARQRAQVDLVAAEATIDLAEPQENPFEATGAGQIVLAPRAHMVRRRGIVTAVTGASGGCGVTEVATELARALGRRGERTVLVDGDELAPCLAQRLSLALHPNLRTAVDVVEHGTGRLAECLTVIASNLEVLVGIPHPKDWVELRGSDMSAVVEELARGRPQVVVNASPEIEDLTAFGAADRFGMSRAAINAADSVVIVCTPTPVGVARLIDRVAELTEFVDNKPIHIAINRVQKGTFKRNEIKREIERSFTPASLHFLPSDPRVERAGWEGTLIPAGEFTRAVASSLAGVIPRSQIPSSSRRRPTRARPDGSPITTETKVPSGQRGR